NVVPIVPVFHTQIVRGAETPACLGKLCSRLLVFNICGQFKRLPGYFRSINETNELPRFAPQIFLSAPDDVFQSAGRPICNGSEDRARRRPASRSPQISDDGLPRWEPLHSVNRDRKSFRPDILAKSKERLMSPEIIDCRSHTLIDLYLFNAWIALDVKDAITGAQIVIELLRATDIQNRIGRFIKLTNFP